MALSRKVGTFLSNTTTGNQAVTGLGFQPKVVLFFGCATSEANVTTTMFAMFGAASSSTERWVASACAITASSVANNSRSFHTDRCIFQVDASETTAYSADLVSMDADGFTVNWTVANSTARYIHYVALGGTDISAKCGTFTKNNTTGNQSVTGVGFQPGCLLFGSAALTSVGLTTSSYLSLGQAVSSTDRYVTSFWGVDTADPMDEQRVTYNDAVYTTINSTPALLERADFVSHDADGFTINNVSATSSILIGYVALGGTARFKGGTITAPVSPSTVTATGVGFSPEVCLFISGATSSAINTFNPNYSAINIGAFDKSGNNATIFTYAQNGVGTSASARHQDLNRCIAYGSAPVNTGIDQSGFLWTTSNDGFTLRFSPSNTAVTSPFLAISGAADTAEYTFPMTTVNTGVHYAVDPILPVPTTAAVVAPYRGYAAYPATYSISGTVKENGVGVSRLVRAYRRDTGELLGETTSAANGSFTLSSSHALNQQVYLIAFDDAGGEAYNAQIFDLITPT